jgi:hypothetical protein
MRGLLFCGVVLSGRLQPMGSALHASMMIVLIQ